VTVEVRVLLCIERVFSGERDKCHHRTVQGFGKISAFLSQFAQRGLVVFFNP